MRKLQDEVPRGGAIDFNDTSSVASNMSYQSSVNEGSTFAQSVGRWMKVGMRWQQKAPNAPLPKLAATSKWIVILFSAYNIKNRKIAMFQIK